MRAFFFAFKSQEIRILIAFIFFTPGSIIPEGKVRVLVTG